MPAGQTAAVYDYRGGIDSTDREPMGMSTMVADMTAAAHTIDLDGSVNTTTGTPAAKYTSLWAFTLELAQASSSSGSLMMMGVGR